MKKGFFIIMLFSLVACKLGEKDTNRLTISCDGIYYHYNKDTEIAYHYYLFSIINKSDKDLVLKRNTKRNNKIEDDLETLELFFLTSNGDTLSSNFVDDWFMHEKDFILWKNETNKVICYLETYKQRLVDKEIYVGSLKYKYNDTLYYDKVIDTLHQRMSFDEALLLMQN